VKPMDQQVAAANQRLAEINTALDPNVHIDVSGLESAARAAASDVRSSAARAHDRVGVRIVRKGDGIRITLVGPAANKYRAFMARGMQQRMPGVMAEIRTQVTRRIK